MKDVHRSDFTDGVLDFGLTYLISANSFHGNYSFLNLEIVANSNTGCPIDMLTTSDQILKIEKSHMPKSKPCFEIGRVVVVRVVWCQFFYGI